MHFNQCLHVEIQDYVGSYEYVIVNISYNYFRCCILLLLLLLRDVIIVSSHVDHEVLVYNSRMCAVIQPLWIGGAE